MVFSFSFRLGFWLRRKPSLLWLELGGNQNVLIHMVFAMLQLNEPHPKLISFIIYFWNRTNWLGWNLNGEITKAKMRGSEWASLNGKEVLLGLEEPGFKEGTHTFFLKKSQWESKFF